MSPLLKQHLLRGAVLFYKPWTGTWQFNTVNHTILLKHLDNLIDICCLVLSWFKFYFLERKQSSPIVWPLNTRLSQLYSSLSCLPKCLLFIPTPLHACLKRLGCECLAWVWEMQPHLAVFKRQVDVFFPADISQSCVYIFFLLWWFLVVGKQL